MAATRTQRLVTRSCATYHHHPHRYAIAGKAPGTYATPDGEPTSVFPCVLYADVDNLPTLEWF